MNTLMPPKAVSKYISAHIAAGLLGLSRQRVDVMCREGVFKTAHKPGSGANAHWRILRVEVTEHIFNSHVQLMDR